MSLFSEIPEIPFYMEYTEGSLRAAYELDRYNTGRLTDTGSERFGCLSAVAYVRSHIGLSIL